MKLKFEYGLIVRGMIATVSWAAAMSPTPALGQGDAGSHADLGFETDVTHLNLTVAPGSGASGGCVGGYVFQAAHGGCIRQTIASQSESRACASGYTGTQTRKRNRPVYMHQNGSSAFGSWGSWSGWAGACTATTVPPDPLPPTVGTTFSVLSGMICVASDAGYYAVSGPSNANRNILIEAYKTFSYYGRCPEPSGYTFWLALWADFAQEYRVANPGATAEYAYGQAWRQPGGVEDWLLDAAGGNKENTPAILADINKLCQDSANTKYGAGKVMAAYVNKSGNKCTVTRVN